MNQSGPETPLCRALLDSCDLSAVASHMAALARPELGTCPSTHLKHAERHLSAWRRGETDRPYLELALARLLLYALTKLNRSSPEPRREEAQHEEISEQR